MKPFLLLLMISIQSVAQSKFCPIAYTPDVMITRHDSCFLNNQFYSLADDYPRDIRIEKSYEFFTLAENEIAMWEFSDSVVRISYRSEDSTKVYSRSFICSRYPEVKYDSGFLAIIRYPTTDGIMFYLEYNRDVELYTKIIIDDGVSDILTFYIAHQKNKKEKRMR